MYDFIVTVEIIIHKPESIINSNLTNIEFLRDSQASFLVITIYVIQRDRSQNMAIIEVEIEINATVDKVWDVVSDIDNEPKFWKGTKKIKNLSKEGNTVNREIIIAFRDQKCLQEVTLQPKEKIQAKFTKGVLGGEKIISLIPKDEKTILRTVWDIKLTGMMSMFTGMLKKHIKSGTEQAMQNIKEEIERQINGNNL